jgi:hypothetical protein
MPPMGLAAYLHHRGKFQLHTPSKVLLVLVRARSGPALHWYFQEFVVRFHGCRPFVRQQKLLSVGLFRPTIGTGYH